MQWKLSDMRKKGHRLVGLLGILVCLLCASATTKPLYVLGEAIFGIEANIKTYNALNNGTIDYVRNNVIDVRCKGPVDLALTPNGRYMFTVSGGSAWIQVVDTTTMTVKREAYVSQTREDFCGVAYDSKRALVYSVDKGQNQLYVHEWDRTSATLTLAANGRITLPGTTTYDIALDLTNDLMFVSNGTNEVHVFNLANWSLQKTIRLGRSVERIALDVRNRILYGGTRVGGHPHLVQYDLLTTVERAVKIGDDASVVGIAVDAVTSFVYVATLHPFYIKLPNMVQVFNGELNSVDQEQIDENIAGLGLPVEGVSYGPLKVSKRITSGTQVIDGVHYVKVGDIIHYEISLSPETSQSNVAIRSGSIVDNLPPELDYVSSSRLNNTVGIYDETLHTVTWTYPSMTLSGPIIVGLETRVPASTAPGKITNEALVLSGADAPLVALTDAFVRELSSPDVRADLRVYASELVGGKYSDQLMAILVLPANVTLRSIDRNIPLILDPGDTEASFQMVYGKDGKVVVDAFFDKTNLLAVINAQRLTTVSLTVTGGFVNGSQFYGEVTIPVTKNLLLQD